MRIRIRIRIKFRIRINLIPANKVFRMKLAEHGRDTPAGDCLGEEKYSSWCCTEQCLANYTTVSSILYLTVHITLPCTVQDLVQYIISFLTMEY